MKMGNDENQKKNDIRNEFVNEKNISFFLFGGIS
jgi:hypothetical protein